MSHHVPRVSLLILPSPHLNLRFSRGYNQGKVPILPAGANNLIYAYSADGTKKLAYHDLN